VRVTAARLDRLPADVVAGRTGADPLFLTDRRGRRHIDCAAETASYFPRWLADVGNRTSSAMPPGHALEVTRLAIRARHLADGDRR
jgi:hypothetical protein